MEIARVSLNPKIVAASERKVTLAGEPASLPLDIDERARDEVRKASRESDSRNLYLNVENIEGEINPGTAYGIYVNLPEAADEETKAKHHVGNVSFFGIELARQPLKDEPAHDPVASAEVGSLLRSLGNGTEFEEAAIDVTFIPLLPKPPEGREEEFQQLLEERSESPPVHIGRVSLGIDA